MAVRFKTTFITALTILLSGTISNAFARDISFYDGANKHKGFYWFEEEKARQNKQAENLETTFESLSPSEAIKNMEERKVKLAQSRAVMMELSYRNAPREEIYKAVKNYKILEKEMRDSGMALASAWEMVNFTNPEIIDQINNPVNVPANKVKREYEGKQKAFKIRNFADKYDLVLFENPTCPYCQAFKPVLGHFVSVYGFKLDIVGNNPEHIQLINMLKIEAAPTLVAVSTDGQDAFELARSFLTLSELEQQVMFATELLENNYQFAVSRKRGK
jgi:thiol-disulfide isomerase/thioredoxin